jgi:hypothetical protein
VTSWGLPFGKCRAPVLRIMPPVGSGQRDAEQCVAGRMLLIMFQDTAGSRMNISPLASGLSGLQMLVVMLSAFTVMRLTWSGRQGRQRVSVPIHDPPDAAAVLSFRVSRVTNGQ